MCSEYEARSVYNVMNSRQNLSQISYNVTPQTKFRLLFHGASTTNLSQILKHRTFNYPVYGVPDASMDTMNDMSAMTFGDQCAVGDVFQLSQHADAGGQDGAVVLALVRMDHVMTVSESFDDFYDHRVETMDKAKRLGYDTLALRTVHFAGTFPLVSLFIL
jgi:hypothetical protein